MPDSKFREHVRKLARQSGAMHLKLTRDHLEFDPDEIPVESFQVFVHSDDRNPILAATRQTMPIECLYLSLLVPKGETEYVFTDACALHTAEFYGKKWEELALTGTHPFLDALKYAHVIRVSWAPPF